MSRALQGSRDTADEIAPVSPWWTFKSIEGQNNSFVEVPGVSLQKAILALRRGDPRIELNGCRHYKAVVVVRGLADKIDSSRRAKHTGVGPVHFPERGSENIMTCHRLRKTGPHGRSTPPR